MQYFMYRYHKIIIYIFYYVLGLKKKKHICAFIIDKIYNFIYIYLNTLKNKIK